MTHYIEVQVARFYGTELLRWEWSCLIVFLILCTHPLLLPSRLADANSPAIHAYAQNRKRAIWTCILLPMVLRVVLLPLVPLKPPSVHDEFSLLLLADTLRSGRLTNPTPSVLATLRNHSRNSTAHLQLHVSTGVRCVPRPGSIVGQSMDRRSHSSVGLMCGAICWMLQAWLPPAWAFGGALIAAIQIGFGSYWMNSFRGRGPRTGMAGALLFGAIPRFFRKPTRMVAVIFSHRGRVAGQHASVRGNSFVPSCFRSRLSRYRSASAETKSAIRLSPVCRRPWFLLRVPRSRFTTPGG